MPDMEHERTCATCAWHDGFTWVCFNGRSPNRAGETDLDESCDEWEEDKGDA